MEQQLDKAVKLVKLAVEKNLGNPEANLPIQIGNETINGVQIYSGTRYKSVDAVGKDDFIQITYRNYAVVFASGNIYELTYPTNVKSWNFDLAGWMSDAFNAAVNGMTPDERSYEREILTLTSAPETITVNDPTDKITIAELQGQVKVLERLLPNTSKVTYEN